MTPLALVLLPGLDGTGLLFRPLLQHLPESIRPVIVTYPPEPRLGYRDLLPTVLRSLPGSEPFALLGESFSGPLALMAAAGAPAGLRAVVLCASFVCNPLPAALRWTRPFVRGACFRAVPRIVRLAALLGRNADPELRELAAAAMAAVPVSVIAHRVRATLDVDVRRELRDCPVPILYMQGTRDRLVNKRSAADVVADQPSTNVVKLPAPHLVLQAQPSAAAAVIVNFLTTSVPPNQHPQPAGRESNM